jgi:hypothetical protein
MKNILQSKKNLAWFPGKCFPFILGGIHFPEVAKKSKNTMLFVDYIKFDPQCFDYYIFF